MSRGPQLFRPAILAFLAVCIPGLAAPAEKSAIPRSGMVLWLDAEASGSESPGDDLEAAFPFGEWQDLSGRSNDLLQDDPQRRPLRIAKAIGGRPAIRFDGNDVLDRASFSGFDIGDQPFHIAIVMQAPAGGPTAQRLIDLQSRNSPTAAFEKRRGFWVGFQGSEYVTRLGIHSGDEGRARSAVWDAKPHLIELVYSGEQLFEIHVDGRVERDAMFNGTHFLGFRKSVALALGQHFGTENNAGTWFKGDIGEVLIYRRPLTAQERFNLGTYLSKKYSIESNFRPLPQFERDIRPVLAKHCGKCHGAETQEAQLDLRTVSAMLHGGEAGPVIVRGDPDQSELLSVIESGKMPPEDETPLSKTSVELIRDWIAVDAPALETVVLKRAPSKLTEKDRSHWAWQALGRTDPPKVANAVRVRNEIDRFVLSRLEAEGLSYSVRANSETLVRRLFFDLIGLPPSPAEIDRFLNDESPERIKALINRMLASKHFGERWGRHWLDVAGYVGVRGSDNDAPIIKPVEGKWRYRDYVIRSFNEDKPFDRFLIEQLAGDELYDWRNAESFTPEMLEGLIATGFLLSANDDTDQNELNTPDVRHHVLQRTAENVANSLLSVTLQCAKCHDHKYEAVTQHDYYRFQSIFAPVFNVRNWVTSSERTRADVSDAEQQLIDQRNREIDAETKTLNDRKAAIRNEHRTRLFNDKLQTVAESDRKAAETAVKTAAEKRTEQQKQLAKKYEAVLAVSDGEIEAALSANERTEIKTNEERVRTLSAQRRSYGRIAISTETEARANTHVLRRGNYLRPGVEVVPELPDVLVPAAFPIDRRRLAADSASGISGRRLALAKALTDADSIAGQHVARVFVNRVWQQLFGAGLVSTSDNFGVSGSKPTHPELLDWLTLQFIEGGWRVKPLVRRIVSSGAWQQSSELSENQHSAAKLDPENRLLWRMNLRRLDSEQIRDAILTASGQLDRSFGGTPIPLVPRPDGMVVLKTDGLPSPTYHLRRSVYILARRNYHLTLMRVFDQPIVARNCSVRKPAPVVTQSLALLHDDFVVEQADHLAGRVISELPEADLSQRIQRGWRIALGRAPDESELGVCLDASMRHVERFREESASQTGALKFAMTQICHMLLNTSEFIYLQ